MQNICVYIYILDNTKRSVSIKPQRCGKVSRGSSRHTQSTTTQRALLLLLLGGEINSGGTMTVPKSMMGVGACVRVIYLSVRKQVGGVRLGGWGLFTQCRGWACWAG